MITKRTSKKSIIDFSIAIYDAIQTFGVEKLTHFLKTMHPFSQDFFDKDVMSESIIQIICVKYNIKMQDLVDKKKIHGEYGDAICLISFFLKKYGNYNAKEISIILKRHKSQISKYLSRISLLREKVSIQDDKLIQTMLEIESQIKKQLLNGKENEGQTQEGYGD